FHRKRNLQYYDVSARSNYNFVKPFLWIIRRMVNVPDLEIVGEIAKAPEISIDPSVVAAAEADLKAAQARPIMDDDDEDLH
ncbi:MAG: uncharacterized protein KVP18_005182, partial [Porospora cf. gigantea A]